MPEAVAIQRMFAGVAKRYDRANRLLSLGVDQHWRRRAVAIAGVRPGERVLDVCAGTGDLSLALCGAGAEVVAADFCREMLSLAGDKIARRCTGRGPRLLCADAMVLPFPGGTFDLCTVAFGIRNVSDPRAALLEMARVVRPGGRVVVLEFARPRTPVLGGLYRFYFRSVLPRLGTWISGIDNGAYRYLPESVMAFPERSSFLALMADAGLASPKMTLLTCGIAAAYRGEVRR
jgi:demethylmenaquinone methyltransferase / 2-methoxy-6-polyprenyl-1,4-benzoquinol methylase